MKREFKIKGIKNFSIEDGENDNGENIDDDGKSVFEKCQEMGFDSMSYLIDIAKDEKKPDDIRLTAAIEINQSIYPHPVIYEHMGPDGDPIRVEFTDFKG